MVKRVIATLFVLALLLLSACSSQNQVEIPNPISNSVDKSGEELKKIESSEELKKLLLEAQIEGGDNYYSDFNVRSLSAVAEIAEDSSAGIAKQSGSNEAASDYSTTNVQVEGVDEADIVKNDGKYIYTLSQNRVLIVEAFPAENAEVIAEIEFENKINVQELFVKDDKLIVLGQGYNELFKVSEQNLVPYPYYEQQTVVQIYSTEDKKKPQLVKEYKVTGSYYNARLIGEHVYFISQENVRSYGDIVTPVLYKDGLRIAQGEIYYFDIRPSSVFYTITSVSLTSLDSFATESYLLDWGATMYVSENNIYIGYQKRFEENSFERFEEVILPLIDREQRAIFEKHLTREDKEGLALTLEQYFNSLDEKDQKKFRLEIQEKSEEYQEKINAELRKTVIHKFSVDNGVIYYLAQGEVDGHLLNQFSLDEHDGFLRVATTKSYWIRGQGSTSYSNVYVLDEELEFVGWIERLAEDERIYSTRFLGDKLYMVTFKQIDPLFVIDLSTPEQPKVLGELKIPGFSSYLHPFGENYLIGVGKDVDEETLRTKGVKVSLFDVSDVENPKEVDNYVVSGRWSDTPVLYDHKAFLFSEAKRMMVIPIRQDLSVGDNYRRDYYQGAYVFEITGDGIDLRGEISHEDSEEGNSYWYTSPYTVQRSLYMNDVLYTISEGKIVANDIESLDEISEVDLDYRIDTRNYPYEYYGEDAVAEIAIDSEVLE